MMSRRESGPTTRSRLLGEIVSDEGRLLPVLVQVRSRAPRPARRPRDPRAPARDGWDYVKAWMFFFSQIRFSSFGHTVTLTSPR